jgi:DNA-binding PadR family transcriptional regulator
LTDGRVKVGPGTLYSLLSRFEDDGYIDMVSDEDNKKTYIITELGKGVLDKEIDRLSLLLKDARSVMGGNDDEFQNRE